MAVNSKDELLRVSLSRVGETPPDGVLSLSSNPLVRNSLTFYDQRFNHLLSVFPWSFAVKNVELQQAGKGTRYRYRYNLPPDILQIWQFDNSSLDVSVYGAYYVPSELYLSYRLPTIPLSAFGNEGAVIGNGVESNWERMYLLYTHDGRQPYRRYTEQFKSILIGEVELDLWKSKEVDSQSLATKGRLIREEREKDLSTESISEGRQYQNASKLLSSALSRLASVTTRD